MSAEQVHSTLSYLHYHGMFKPLHQADWGYCEYSMTDLESQTFRCWRSTRCGCKALTYITAHRAHIFCPFCHLTRANSVPYSPALHSHSHSFLTLTSPTLTESVPALAWPWWAGLGNHGAREEGEKILRQSSSLIYAAMQPTDAHGESGSGANWEQGCKWKVFLNFKAMLPLPLFSSVNPNHQLPKAVRRTNLVTLASNICRNMIQ